ncbi:hypothetical protein [Rhodobaculum claviforme]|uniref:Uncharacterized protein n=1 Tax=Rhodobaculum claviforme TaxID=1549854 RepID=A0A934WIA3_9RHOB|nr:hypothetical protein [Rhodobaculum claviforme]MBK5926552.1 hypothetical protein [Rhodobaculum claviforme]
MAQPPLTPAHADPKGLVRESYRIAGIGPAECRSIFVDWALSLPPGVDTDAALRALLAEYGGARADHPMTALLQEGLATPAPPPGRRRRPRPRPRGAHEG